MTGRKSRPASASDRQNDSRFFSPNFLVYIYSSIPENGAVVARLPEELQMQLASDWDTPLLSSGSTPIGALIESGFGVSTKTQFASAQVWSGSSPIEITLPLEFYADKNPRTEVIDPIIKLSRMALPRRSGVGGDKGLFTPPGPRIFNLNTNKITNDQISIDIGNFLNFTKVIITQVNPTFVTRDMTNSGYPLKATCEVTFRSMFSLTGEDFSGMFKDAN